MRRFRTLFLNDGDQSKQAIELFRTNGLRFSSAPVAVDSQEFPPETLPVLITDQGEWRGLEAIQRYVKNALVWGEADACVA